MDPKTTDTNVEPTAAEVAETQEWDDAAKDLFPGLHKTVDEDTTTTTTVEVEDTTTTTTVEPDVDTTTTTTIDPNETDEQKAEREKKEAEIAKEVEDNLPDTTARDQRQVAREAKAQVEATAKDVREKMFKDAPANLVDGDGDPILTIQDVMLHNNPATGEPFENEEQAGVWLLAAQKKFNENLAAMDQRINEIAEVNVDLKDQADSVTYRYGELLKADTDLRDRIWTEYEKTLVKDPDTGIIIGMPVSLESFYDIALAPYAKLAETMENQTAEEKRIADEAAKKAEEDKKKERADRSDIFGRGNVDDITDPEDKEWAAAATAVFGPRKN